MLDSASERGKKTRPRAPSLEKGLAILELLGGSKRGLTLSETSRRLGLPKSTTHCLLTTLREQQYATCSELTGRYQLGPRFFHLSSIAIQGARLRERTTALLRALQEATGLTVHLAILGHKDVILIEKVDTVGTRLATWVGRRMEAHCTAVGKAILAYLPEAELDDHILSHGLPKHNENTLSSAKKLKSNLAGVRALGYALDDEEDELGFRCVAAPIFGRNGEIIASVSLAGTVEQVAPENVQSLSSQAKQMAAEISKLVAADE